MVIVVGIVVFTVVIVALVALLMFAGSKLLPQGKVKIGINGNPEMAKEVAPGHTVKCIHFMTPEEIETLRKAAEPEGGAVNG